MRYDLHVHSKYSKDSMLSPESIISAAKRKGLDGIAITDHDTIRGGLAAQKINEDPDFTVIVGAEIKTECDDVIGLFLNEEIKSISFAEVIDEIWSQGGLAGLPHPYRKYKYPERIAGRFDFIEGFNARSKKEDNGRAYRLAAAFNKPAAAGSDAHFAFEIGRGALVCDTTARGALATTGDGLWGKESNYYFVHGCSLLTEKVKKALM